ncbi:MAG: hypothetical protein JW940_25590 [Polyangiaceae bacterium]|nr:hypothetical protein [Polyangiaceae bacterium]
MVILPSPLLTAREEEAAPAVEWTRAGVAAARKHGCSLPLLATVALDERVLNEAAFAPLGYLDAVVSQISACRGIHGVYVVIAQTGDPGHPFKTGELVHRAYASLCRRFREARRIETVFPNFCDIGGFVCVARGATGFATGNFQSTRRLMLSGGADGRPYLYYYAHSAATEFRPEEDLDPIAEAGLFERIADPTPYAAALVTALRTTRSAAGQQPWLMTINNVGTAQRHQLYRMCLSTHGVLSSSAENRYAVVEQWASTAVTLQSGLLAKVDPQKTRYTAPVDALLRALRAA